MEYRALTSIPLKKVVFICILILLVILFIVRLVVSSFSSSPNLISVNSASSTTSQSVASSTTVVAHAPCLADDEFANVDIVRAGATFGWDPGILTVLIGKKANDKLKTRLFDLPIYQWNIDHAAEIHNCHIYLLQTVGGFDYNKRKSLPGGTISIFRYDYSGKREKVIDVERVDALSNQTFNYVPGTFAVDASEIYIALVSPHPDADRRLVVLNMKTGETIFTTAALDLAKEYKVDPGLGDINTMWWNNAGLHFQLNNSDQNGSPTVFELQKNTWKIISVF